ncbi:hypothetical protein DFJ74DRAFT_704463 [Hyaloraphidium curvatum]|nr:hypothetical protein DFJ74DRAFT_704463 [Hyaloraphidium curvatum]
MKDKVVIVTGGTEGEFRRPRGVPVGAHYCVRIGRAIVERLLDMGAKVMVGNRNVELAEKELKAGRPAAASSIAFQRTDICSVDDNRALFRAAVQAFGTCDAVVANAGFSVKPFFEEVEEGSDDEWIRGIQGNLIGTMVLARTALTYWTKEDKTGAIVITSSIAGFFPSLGQPCMSYSVTKAAENQFVKNLQVLLEGRAKAKGLERASIRCNSVMPGMVWTNIWKKSRHADKHYQDQKDFEERNPFGKALFEANGRWTPMDKLVDAYIRCLQDESVRGKCFVVNGEGGAMVEYPVPGALEEGGPLNWMENYVSRK